MATATLNKERAQVGWGFWLQWVVATLAGFSAGFLLQALVTGLWGDRPETAFNIVAAAVVLLLGGALIGLLQYRVLWRALGGAVPALSGSSLAPTAGVIVGATVAGTLFGSIAQYDPVAIFLVSLVGGALGGVVARWLILRRPVGVAGWGLAATSLSLAMGFFLGAAFGGGGVDFLVASTMLGIVGGLVQWRVMRPQAPRAGWWVLASGLGFAVSAFIVAGFPDLFTRLRLGFGFYEQLYAAKGETVGDVIILTMWGVFGGIVAGAITGALLVWLLRHAAKATAATALAASVR